MHVLHIQVLMRWGDWLTGRRPSQGDQHFRKLPGDYHSIILQIPALCCQRCAVGMM